MKYVYDIEFKLDDVENDWDYTDEFTTKKAVKSELRRLRREYGSRIVDFTIKKWTIDDYTGEVDELDDAFDFSSIEEAIKKF